MAESNEIKYNKESINTNNIANTLKKEIEELKDKKHNNDRIESGIIVNNKLNNELKGYFEKNKDFALSIINEINGIKTKNLSQEVIQDLQNLVKLITGIVYGSSEGKESEGKELEGDNQEFDNLTDIANQSFDKFEKFIDEKKNLSSINQEIQNIINFIYDDDNNIRTLSLYSKIASLPEETKETNKEVLNKISEAIKSHFNVHEGFNIETAKKLQLDEIFKNKKTKHDLADVYKKYIGENWDGNNLTEKQNFKNEKHLNIQISDFINRFNKSLNKININNTVNKDKIGKNMNAERVNNIKNYVNKIMGGNNNEFLIYEGNELKYDTGKIRKFLGTINENNYNRISRDGRVAWISAVQLFINKFIGGNLKIDGEYIKGGETYNSVLNFQKEYNKNHKNKLKEDGIPGPKTLKILLGINTNDNLGGSSEWIDTGNFDENELDILNIKSENFYEGYNYTKEEIEAHHHYKRGRIIENIQSYIQNVIKEKRNIGRREIIEHIRSDLVTLPKKEKADIIEGVHKIIEKFNSIIKYLDFKNGPYKSPKSLLCAIQGIKDQRIIENITNDITVKQHGVGLTFFVGDKNSYHIIYGRGTQAGQGSGGFNCAYSAIPELKGTLSVVNGKDPGNNINDYRYGTIIHEGQHNRNSYFMPDKLANKPITRAKDEITAYLRDGKRNIQQIEDTLTKPKSNGGLYQYNLEGQDRERHKTQVRTLLKYVKNLMQIVNRKIGLTKDKVISMLSDTPETGRKNMHDKIIQAVKNGLNIKEFWRTGTAEKQTEINEINLANSINEIKHILNDPKYSHISRVPNNKGGIEISAIIDKVVAGKLDIKYIPTEIREKVQNLL